ncbi:MAG TPA: Gfo/Idh/MocA family oxidoreductase [Candidatus Angelobacter sp.]|nr:Gfo/Idh/MocA family oxidoreductase [Candidatus Angelobacter sp.]
MIRFGIVGTNWITDRFLKGALKVEGFSLNAIYSRSVEKTEEFALKYGVKHKFINLEEMANSNQIDAVYIATPNSLHAEQSILFLKNGKHVLCEKPFASNTKEVKKMIETARKHNVLLMEAMKSTFYPNFKSIQDNLEKIGSIRRFTAVKNQFSSGYNRYLDGALPNAFNPELSNGSLMDIGVYGIYPILFLFGNPKSITASCYKLKSGVDGGGTILMHFEDKEAVVMHSKTTTSNLPSEILGEKGSILIDSISSPTKIEIQYVDGRKEDITRSQDKDPFCYEAEEFVRLIREGRTESLINTYERSLQVMEIVTEARKQMGINYPADRQ